MQAVAYYVDLLQYEIIDTTTVEPPFTLAPATQADDAAATTATIVDATTSSPIASTVTPKMPVSTTSTTTPSTPTTTRRPWSNPTTVAAVQSRPTAAHAPGNYAPTLDMIQHVFENRTGMPAAVADAAGAVAAPSSNGPLPLLSISNQQFFNWFLQSKDETVTRQSGT